MITEENNITGEKRPAQNIQENERKKQKQKNKHIPITLEKCVSLLDGRPLLEYFPKERIKALLKSDKLSLEWENPSYSQQYTTQNYLNEVDQLKAYLAK